VSASSQPLDAAARAFLRAAMVAFVATRSPKSRPFLTPLWFVVDRGEIYVTTGTNTWAARNISRDPQVTLLLGGERAMHSRGFLRLRGTATCQAGFPPLRVLLRIAAKYYLAPSALRTELRNVARWGLRARYYGGVPGGAGYIQVVPTAAEFLAAPDRGLSQNR
jgi:Pyridoxamine 5'-phosphate oxidase